MADFERIQIETRLIKDDRIRGEVTVALYLDGRFDSVVTVTDEDVVNSENNF